MPKIQLGPTGAVVDTAAAEIVVDTAVMLEKLGFPTLWLSGGPLTALAQVAEVVRATERVRVATGILSVDRFPADDVAALCADLEATHPGRFVAGLGGAHGPKPLPTLNRYLDRLDSGPHRVPPTARVMAALGPRMLDLARERAAGAFPVLVTPEYTARARARLGDEPTLAVEQLVVVETQPERARELARTPLGFLGRLPAYRANFRRMGFDERDIAGLSDPLVDALVAWGDADAVAARVAEQRAAGADHVAVNLVIGSGPPPIEQWRELASRLVGVD